MSRLETEERRRRVPRVVARSGVVHGECARRMLAVRRCERLANHEIALGRLEWIELEDVACRTLVESSSARAQEH